MASNFDQIPQELRALPQWVVHDAKKKPFTPLTSHGASPSEPKTWTTFDKALKTLESGNFAGLGFVLNGNGIVGIDIDDCRDPQTGEISETAQSIVEALNSYTEISPSGTGLHIFAKGSLPEKGRKNSKSGIEMYYASRYITVTGQTYGPARPLADRGQEISAVFCRQFPVKTPAKEALITSDTYEPDALAEAVLIGQAKVAKNGEKFSKLWAGDWQKDYASQSEADQALCNHLAFWSKRNSAQIDYLFRQSGLYRAKWDENRGDATYGEMTVSKAVRDCTKIYGEIESQESPNIPEAFSAKSLLEEDIPPIKWAVKELIPEGLTLIVAPPKSGKSWMMLDLGLSVAAGESFLGKETIKGHCLYLALEDGKRRLKDRMLRLLPFEDTVPDTLDFWLEIPPLGMGFQEQVTQYIQAHKELRLIIVDTLQRVRIASSNNKNAYAQDYAEMTILKKIADAHNLALIVVHHTKKGKDDTDPFMQISGTNGIFGVADTILMLERKQRGNDQATLHITGRDLEASSLLVGFDKTLCHWVVLGDAEKLVEQQERGTYEGSSLVMTIKSLISESKNGEWRGTMQEIYDAGFFEEDVRALGKQLKAFEPKLLEYDSIGHEMKRTNGNNVHIFKQNPS